MKLSVPLVRGAVAVVEGRLVLMGGLASDGVFVLEEVASAEAEISLGASGAQ